LLIIACHGILQLQVTVSNMQRLFFILACVAPAASQNKKQLTAILHVCVLHEQERTLAASYQKKCKNAN